MRGNDHNQSAMFSYLSPDERVPANHPLRAVRRMTDEALKGLSARFSRMYAKRGRPSIPPEKLLRALLLQVFYTVRSERMLMEQLDYNMLFRWFVGLNMDDRVWDASTFSQNRERLLKGDVAEAFFAQVRRQAEAAGLMSDEHFTVDGTLIEAWAGQKSLRRVDGGEEPPTGGGRNPEVNFHGEKRANDTHVSSTDPEAMLARKTRGSETKLAYRGHLLTENRNGLIVQTMLTHAYGNAETHAALLMLAKVPGTHRITCGADKGYDTAEFERECRNMNVVAHAARKAKGGAVPARRAQGAGYRTSQRRRKLVEERFGWMKTVGTMRKTRHRGKRLVGWMFAFTGAACNLVRMRKLMAATA